MKHLSIELRAEAPLAIRADHAPGGVETAKYISGTTLVGSLASVHRLLHSERTDEFETLFLSGQVHYPNLYPASFSDKDVQGEKQPVYPVPKTAQSCKKHPGFLSDEDNDDEPHGVRDSLFDWAMFKLIGERQGEIAALQAFRAHKLCPQCEATMDHFEGYYSRSKIDPYNMALAKVDTRTQTHTGINRETGTVQENILYNREVLEEDMQFWGMVKLPDTLADTFREFVEAASEEGLVRIGTGRTRGMGKVRFAVEQQQDDEQERFSLFKARLEKFNAALLRRAKAYTLTNTKPFYFALTLHSPLIMNDSLFRYLGSINEERLAKLSGLPVAKLQRVYQTASTRRVMGWHELWGTPRTIEYAVDTGSVFLFAYAFDADDTDDAKEAFLRSLFELEEQGIGHRLAEGFGRICVSDTFHLEEDLR